MRRREPARLTREQYKARLDAGQQFRGATLYEPDHAPREAEFFMVDLGPGVGLQFKRRIK